MTDKLGTTNWSYLFFTYTLFPIRGVLNGKAIAAAYINDAFYLFIGRFLMVTGYGKIKLTQKNRLKGTFHCQREHFYDFI